MTSDTGYSLVKDISLVLLGWVMGLFTLPFARDGEAKEKCLNKLNELKRVLESLSKHMKNHTSEQQYYNHLMQAKVLFEDLNVCQTGLLFYPHDLSSLLAESLTIMYKMDQTHLNQAYHVTQTAVRIEMLWNGNKPISSDFEPLKKIQQSISKHIFGRIADLFRSLVKRFNPETASKK